MPVYFAGFVPCEQGFAVLFPDFPGCNSQGATLPEAFANAVEALAGHMAVMVDDGDALPPPSGGDTAWERLRELFAGLDMGPLPTATELHPVPAPALDTTSKKVNVSFPAHKLEMIDRKAKAAGMTRSGFLAHAAEVYAQA